MINEWFEYDGIDVLNWSENRYVGCVFTRDVGDVKAGVKYKDVMFDHVHGSMIVIDDNDDVAASFDVKMELSPK